MKIRIKKGQSIIEYICVFIVFAAAGVVAFFAVTRTSASSYQNKSVDQILQSSQNTSATSNP